MQKNIIFITVSALIMAMPANAEEQDVLTGDPKLACEAVLCLATGTRPGECTPSLQKYFSISYRSLKDTIQGRLDFLSLCPTANQTTQMQSLVSAMANGAGRCDPESLNASLLSWSIWDDGKTFISDQMPSYCSAYTDHSYVDFLGAIPRYVGVPERGGYWVEAKDYEIALAEYNSRIVAEDEAKSRSDYSY